MIHWWLWTQRGGGNVGPVSAVTPGGSLQVLVDAEPCIEGVDAEACLYLEPAGLLLIPNEDDPEDP